MFLAVYLTSGVHLGNIHTGDTDNLVKGARFASNCLDRGVLIGCGHHKGTPSTDVYPYPALQYIPSLVMIRLGLADVRIVGWLAHLSTVALLATVAALTIGWRKVTALQSWRPELVAATVTGPLLFYGLSGFGEMLAAFMGLVFVLCAAARRPWAAAITLALACLGKETLAPFLFVLGILCARRPEDGWLPERRMTMSLVIGAGSGLFLSAAFNVFRFGTPLNLFYTQAAFRTDGLKRTVGFFFGLWFAPSSGFALFWVTALALFALVSWTTVRAALGNVRDLRRWLPGAAAVAVLVGFQVGLAVWAFPFGWIAWGPRLTLPIVPAALVCALIVGGDSARALLDRILSRPVAIVALALVLAAVTLPQAGALWAYRKSTDALLAADARCPGLQKVPDVVTQRKAYFDCATDVMWRRHPSPLLSPVHIDRTDGRIAQLCLAVLAVLLTVICGYRARLRRRLGAVTNPGLVGADR